MSNARFYAHEGADCITRYLVAEPRRRAINEIIYGPVGYAIHLKWKEGGQSMYLQRLHEMGLIAGGGKGQ